MYVPPMALECISSECSECGVSLGLSGMTTEAQVINLDCLKRAMRVPGNIADCGVLLRSRGMFAVVELKSAQDRSKVEAQVEAGLKIVDQMTQDQHLEDFFPIFIYTGRDPTAAFKGMRFEIRGIRRRIIPRPSPSELLDILRSSRRNDVF